MHPLVGPVSLWSSLDQCLQKEGLPEATRQRTTSSCSCPTVVALARRWACQVSRLLFIERRCFFEPCLSNMYADCPNLCLPDACIMAGPDRSVLLTLFYLLCAVIGTGGSSTIHSVYLRGRSATKGTITCRCQFEASASLICSCQSRRQQSSHQEPLVAGANFRYFQR